MRLLLEPGDLPPFLLDLPCSVTDFKLVALLQRFDLAQLVAVVVLRRARALLCYLLVRADFGKAKLQLAHLGLVMLILSLLLLVLLFNRLGLLFELGLALSQLLFEPALLLLRPVHHARHFLVPELLSLVKLALLVGAVDPVQALRFAPADQVLGPRRLLQLVVLLLRQPTSLDPDISFVAAQIFLEELGALEGVNVRLVALVVEAKQRLAREARIVAVHGDALAHAVLREALLQLALRVAPLGVQSVEVEDGRPGHRVDEGLGGHGALLRHDRRRRDWAQREDERLVDRDAIGGRVALVALVAVVTHAALAVPVEHARLLLRVLQQRSDRSKRLGVARRAHAARLRARWVGWPFELVRQHAVALGPGETLQRAQADLGKRAVQPGTIQLAAVGSKQLLEDRHRRSVVLQGMFGTRDFHGHSRTASRSCLRGS
mmetsp:Transcript_32777/g.71959  ORF Transcript_32777/g.71959 Transcript_32777/m.71959 type:complete len:433 (+) Transcript_32777:1408-2706(+)